jgi:hypothetical protein
LPEGVREYGDFHRLRNSLQIPCTQGNLSEKPKRAMLPPETPRRICGYRVTSHGLLIARSRKNSRIPASEGHK